MSVDAEMGLVFVADADVGNGCFHKFILYDNLSKFASNWINMSDLQKEFRTTSQQMREKYIYYIIALAVSAIAYSALRTVNQTPNWRHWFLVCAIVCWSLSIHFGVTFLRLNMGTLMKNATYLHYKKHDNIPEIASVLDDLKNEMIDSQPMAIRKFERQWKFLYYGFGFYIIWHVFEMFASGHTSP